MHALQDRMLSGRTASSSASDTRFRPAHVDLTNRIPTAPSWSCATRLGRTPGVVSAVRTPASQPPASKGPQKKAQGQSGGKPSKSKPSQSPATQESKGGPGSSAKPKAAGRGQGAGAPSRPAAATRAKATAGTHQASLPNFVPHEETAATRPPSWLPSALPRAQSASDDGPGPSEAAHSHAESEAPNAIAATAADQAEDARSHSAASSSAGSEGHEEEEGDAGSDDAAGGGDSSLEDGDEEVFPHVQLRLPPASKVKVKAARYLQSCVSVSGCPPPRHPEFAVIGRSNVGKSSLINMMTGRRELALVSKQPGKTKCINHFLINESWYLVDLPGYGFAKVGQESRVSFDAFTRAYLTQRPNLAMTLLLVDASVPPQRIDLQYANWLTDSEVPFALVFTKADKRRKGLDASSSDSHVTAFKRALLQDLAVLPPCLLTSAARGLGRGQLMTFMAGLRAAYEQSGRLEAIRAGML